MAKVPIWLLGKHITSLTVTGVTIGTDGTETPGTSKSLSGFIDGVEFTLQNTTENIQSIDRRQANNVITEYDFSFTLTEILKTNDSSGAPTNLLADISATFDYVRISLARGGRTWGPFDGVIGSYAETFAKGKSTGKLELKAADNGGVNPALT